ncbi:MAG: class II fructose-bisphosphate aldolase [Candidatus Aminicenantes bacterium]|nr:class II fructose-bisphosphate aldolase [Candidatus Aminicenantes bacterium]
MSEKAVATILKDMSEVLVRTKDGLDVKDEAALRGRIDGLVAEAVFGDDEAKAAARWVVWEAAQALGIRPASIQDLYLARGRGSLDRAFTVPAMNLRMLAYDSARAVFRAAHALEAGALIFEIARSEIGYTDQRPAEYATAVLAAAIKEGVRGPVFIQGDHFQVSAKKYAVGGQAELKAIRDLIVEALAAGFYNIDIDTSTLVDLSKPTLAEQQALNYGLCADLTRFIREREPKGLAVSVGGEIGEVGQKNSTPEDLDAFMDGYAAKIGASAGISKISVQTGTSHGGVVLPDGTLAKVAIDFDVLRVLSENARKKYGMGGAVQHGASTLPEAAFHKFVEAGACEVHLATAFQTLIMDHEATPEALRAEVNEWLKANVADERKPADTEAQFLYKVRKKAIGPFKRRFWSLPEDGRAAIGASLENQFLFLFEQLAIAGTARHVEKYIRTSEIHQPLPGGGIKKTKGESVDGLAD